MQNGTSLKPKISILSPVLSVSSGMVRKYQMPRRFELLTLPFMAVSNENEAPWL